MNSFSHVEYVALCDTSLEVPYITCSTYRYSHALPYQVRRYHTVPGTNVVQRSGAHVMA